MHQPIQTIGVRDIAISALTIATALTHISLLFPDPVFILNGIGYLGLLGLLYLPLPFLAPYRGYVRWLLIGYTVLTIALWVAFGLRTPIGYVNKATELALLALLIRR
jgi:hypothetical protein